MGSSYFGEANRLMGGNERGSSGSSSSSRKGKKGNNSGNSSEKQPKQPQRGLGVAQLEKIRLTGQLGYNHHHPSSYHINPNYPSNLTHQEDIRGQSGYSSIPSSSFSYSSSPMPSYAYNPNIMMGGGTDYDRSSMRYGDHHTQPTAAAPSWNHPGHSLYESRQPNAAKHLFNLHEQTTTSRSKKHRSSGSNGSSSQNSESSDSQELDLELRLSL